MSEVEARKVLAARAGGQLCVRYLYDARGRVVFAGDAGAATAPIIPAFNLTRRAKARIARTALLAVPLVLFEACGGAPDDTPVANWQQRDAASDVLDAGVDPSSDAGSGDGGRR